MSDEVCCAEVISLRTKVNIFQGIVGLLFTASLVLFSVSSSQSAEQEKASSNKMDTIAAAVHKIDKQVTRNQVVLEALIKRLDDHRTERIENDPRRERD